MCAGLTLENAKASFRKYSKDPGFEYLNQLADHVDLIGHVAMRNVIAPLFTLLSTTITYSLLFSDRNNSWKFDAEAPAS